MGNNGLYSFTASIIGVILITIIIFRQRKTSMKFFAFFLFTLTATNFLLYMFESKNLIAMPFLFRIGPLISYLIAPSLYFYTLFELNEKRKLKWLDALHLLPAILFLVDYFPLIASSNSYKKQIIKALFQNKENVLLFREGWLLPPETHFILRHIIALIYTFFMVRMLMKLYSSSEKKFHMDQQKLSWIMLIVAIFFLFSAIGIVTNFYIHSPYAWSATIWAPLIVFSILSLILLFKPHLLYGIELTSQTETVADNSKQVMLTDELSFKLQANLHNFLENKQYLRKNLKIGDVADGLGVQTYILSAYINRVYQMHFNDFINWFRIQYIVEGLKKEDWNQLTLEAIAEKAGFSNRTTFLTAFKKFMRMTPSAFLQEAKNDSKLNNSFRNNGKEDK